MTVDDPKRYFLQDCYIFFSVPLCAAFGMLQFGDIFKAVGITLFVCAFCIIYKLYDRYTRAALDNKKCGIKQEIFSVSGFIFTVCVAVFSDISMFRWLFLIGILLSVFFSGIISSFMSVFAYVLITTIFTEATPEYVAKSLLTAVILIILTRYYSDFVSLVYSIICLLSFEAAFFLILHGMDMEMLFSLYYLKEALIITICVIIGWLMFKQINSIIKEAEVTEGTEAKDETVDLDEKDGKAVSDVLESEIKVADVEKSNKDGFVVGSRGSVGSSIVANLSQITEVNPLPPHYLCEQCKYFEWSKDTDVHSG